jgi:hypothetical protein
MLIANPVRGTIAPDKKNYPTHPDAIDRPAGSHIPLVTQDFGPSTVVAEPSMAWPGGESNLFGTAIAAKTYDNFHVGIDISKGGCGSDVLAVADGRVRVARVDGSNANVIVVDHGVHAGHNWETRYVHVQSPFMVHETDQVTLGMIIGRVGDTGNLSTGCHLHFAITRDGNPVDPWRRLLQNTSVDPDVPVIVPFALEVPDVPIPASNADYVAGQVAIVGNTNQGAVVRVGPKIASTAVRTIAAGTQERWLPTCFVKGETFMSSDRWLTRWNNGQWEFTHFNNVRSVTPL